MSFRLLPDGRIEVSTIDELIAIRDKITTPEMDSLRAFARAVEDQLPGAALADIPELIRKLRLSQPDDRLRIERNYWKSRAQELAEEVVIWRRRAEGETRPTLNLFEQLEAQIRAATSSFVSLPPKSSASQAPAAVAVSSPAVAPAAPAPAAVEEPPAEPEETESPAERPAAKEEPPQPGQELRAIRLRLGISQGKMATLVGLSQPYLSQVELGRATCRPDVLERARALPDQPAPAERTAPPKPVKLSPPPGSGDFGALLPMTRAA